MRVLFLNTGNLHLSDNPDATEVLIDKCLNWNTFSYWDNKKQNYARDANFNDCLDEMGVEYKVVSKGKFLDYDLSNIDCTYTMKHGMY